MQPRRISRELALLGISQLPANPDRLKKQDLQSLVLTTVRTLTTEVHDALEAASAELNRSFDRLLESEVKAADVKSAQTMLKEAIELTRTAVNRLGRTIDLPEFVYLANQEEVQHYALQILLQASAHKEQIETLLNQSLVDWQLERLARVDRDLLRVAVTEILFLEAPPQVAINEAVELAKRYSSDNGHRFVNGVLRRVLNQIEATKKKQASS